MQGCKIPLAHWHLRVKCYAGPVKVLTRTSDSGNGNHSVSLPIILIKIKVDQMLPSSYIRLLFVSIL